MIKLTFSIFIYSNKTNFFYQLFKILSFIYVKMPRDSWAKYYQNNKERLQKKPMKEEKEKKWHYSCERYKNFSEDGKQKLFEYRKSYIKWEKMPYYN